MDIQKKLILSARPGKLTLIREGMFLKCYQQSLFSLVHSVYPDIKITGRRIKKLNGQRVFWGGFPESRLTKALPEAVVTEWGAEADCTCVEEGDYQEWLAALPLSDDAPADAERLLTLSAEACRFLDSWQPGRFPPSVEAGFIQGLKALRDNDDGHVA